MFFFVIVCSSWQAAALIAPTWLNRCSTCMLNDKNTVAVGRAAETDRSRAQQRSEHHGYSHSCSSVHSCGCIQRSKTARGQSDPASQPQQRAHEAESLRKWTGFLENIGQRWPSDCGLGVRVHSSRRSHHVASQGFQQPLGTPCASWLPLFPPAVGYSDPLVPRSCSLCMNCLEHTAESCLS